MSTFSAGAAIGLLLFPVAMRVLVHYRGANLLLGLWASCLFVGPTLAAVTSGELGRGLDLMIAARIMLQMLSAGITLYTLLWSRSVIGLKRTAVLYAVGAIAHGVVGFSGIAHNPWKFALALPVAICLLAVARTKTRTFLVLATLAVISIVFQFRSFAAICALTMLVVFVATSKGLARRKFDGRFLAIFSLSIVLLYQIGTIGLLNGWFGTSLQNLALTQSRGGEVSLIVGARSEFAAAVALFQSRPVGFGPGVIPSVDDVATGFSALERLGVGTNSEYVQTYLFGGRLELHSILSDSWLFFGFAGLLLSAAILWHIAVGLLDSETRLAVGALGVLLGIGALWDMAFSPLSALDNVVLALALLLPAQLQQPSGESGRERDSGDGSCAKSRIV